MFAEIVTSLLQELLNTMGVRWLRAMAALTTVASGGALWQLTELITHADSRSSLMIAAAAVTGLLGFLGVLLTIAPQNVLQFAESRIVGWLQVVRTTPLIESPRSGRALMACGLAAYVVITGVMLSRPDDPQDDDQGAFLHTAAEVQAGGGPAGLVRDLLAGRFAEANRHPLYIALLSINPTPAFGRALSCLLGLATLVILTMIARRQRGELPAGLLCVLLGTNLAFCRISTLIVCDVLMVFWGGLLFALAGALTGRAAVRPDWRVEASLGGVAGLAYLTKGTGVPILVGVILWRAYLWRLGEGRNRRAVASVSMIMLGFAIVSSPLLVRNVTRYGSPLYNVNNWLLFVDEFEQPVPLSQRLTMGEAARDYWNSHTVTEMAARMTSGLVWESFILLRMLGPFPLDDARILFGLPLALFALVSGLARPRPEHILLGCWTVLFVGMFAWYVPIAAGERFLLPLLAPLLLCASEGALRLVPLAGVRVGVNPPHAPDRL